jgi:FSR family fosmidomycin resistance protein-like MFS transporter
MIFIGLLADRVRMRYLVIITPAITCVVMSLIGLAPNFAILAIMLFITGLSSAFFHVPTPVMMRKISGDRVGLGMSIYMVGGELSRTLGPLMILAAITWWDFEGAYRLIPFGIASSIFLYFRLRKIDISQDVAKQSQTRVP